MPTGFTYTTYKAALAPQVPTSLTDANFLAILPACIDYAELSIYRDLDFLVLHGQFTVATTAPGQVEYAIPNTIIVVEALQAVGVGAIVPASRDFIAAVFAGAPQGPPRYYCAHGNSSVPNGAAAQAIRIGPMPDSAYQLAAFATSREPPLSASYPATFISTNLPDLFWAASMIFLSGYMKNFGAMMDDPKMAVSWESEYQRILKGATVEEARKKQHAEGWSAQQPSPIATPPRK